MLSQTKIVPKSWLAFDLNVVRRLKFESVLLPFNDRPALGAYLKRWNTRVSVNDPLQSAWVRSLAQITAIQQAMPPGQFTPPPTDWAPLRRTRRLLTEGGDLRLLALGRGDEAAKRYEEALGIDASLVAAHFNLGRVLEALAEPSLPVFISKKQPVPYVFFARPGAKQPCPNSAAC